MEAFNDYIQYMTISGLPDSAKKQYVSDLRNSGFVMQGNLHLQKSEVAEAFECYKKAVEQGETDAYISLGICYEYGIGTDADPGRGAEMYEMALQQRKQCMFEDMGGVQHLDRLKEKVLAPDFKKLFLEKTTGAAVRKIVFSGEISKDAYSHEYKDISCAGDQSVIGWLENTVLHIEANGKITAPEDSSQLFAGMRNLETVEFHDVFYTAKTTVMRKMFGQCKNLTALDLSGFDTGKVTSMKWMFEDCGKLEDLNLSGFDTGNVTDMAGMFYGCDSLRELDLSGFDAGHVRDTSWMFCGCSHLRKLNLSGFYAENIYDVSSMFLGCTRLPKRYKKLPESADAVCRKSHPMSKVKIKSVMREHSFEITRIVFAGTISPSSGLNRNYDLSEKGDHSVIGWIEGAILHIEADGMIAAPDNCVGLFSDMTALESIEFGDVLETGDVISMRRMFASCYSLKKLDLSEFETKSVRDMSDMFLECRNLRELDLDGFETGNVTNMNSMFFGCGELKQLELIGFETGNVTDMSGMFYKCSKLNKLDLTDFETGSVADMRSMFYECRELKELDLGCFETEKTKDMGWMFFGCRNLAELNISSFHIGKTVNTEGMFDGCDILPEKYKVPGMIYD